MVEILNFHHVISRSSSKTFSALDRLVRAAQLAVFEAHNLKGIWCVLVLGSTASVVHKSVVAKDVPALSPGCVNTQTRSNLHLLTCTYYDIHKQNSDLRGTACTAHISDILL